MISEFGILLDVGPKFEKSLLSAGEFRILVLHLQSDKSWLSGKLSWGDGSCLMGSDFCISLGLAGNWIFPLLLSVGRV